jgi:hypothetical protein
MMNSRQVVYDVILDAEVCCQCDMVFAIPHTLRLRLRKSHAIFYCPAGHAQHYTGESSEDQLRQEVERLRKRAENLRAEYDQEWKAHKATERRLSAAKGVLTKTKKRIAHGVCPCCNRTFQNLANHMKGKHPDYETQHEA